MKELIPTFDDERMKSIAVFISPISHRLLLTFIDWLNSVFLLLLGMFLLFA